MAANSSWFIAVDGHQIMLVGWSMMIVADGAWNKVLILMIMIIDCDPSVASHGSIACALCIMNKLSTQGPWMTMLVNAGYQQDGDASGRNPANQIFFPKCPQPIQLVIQAAQQDQKSTVGVTNRPNSSAMPSPICDW